MFTIAAFERRQMSAVELKITSVQLFLLLSRVQTYAAFEVAANKAENFVRQCEFVRLAAAALERRFRGARQ